MSFCGSTTMSERQTVNEALDFFLDHSPAENENMKLVAKEAPEKEE